MIGLGQSAGGKKKGPKEMRVNSSMNFTRGMKDSDIKIKLRGRV